MNHDSSFRCLALVLIFVAGPSLAATPGDVLFVEIGADPDGGDGIAEPAGEYFVLHNTTGNAIDLGGWSVTDNGVTPVTLSGTLMPSQSMVLVADAATLGTDAGTYDCAGWTPKNSQPPGWFSNGLSNGGDRLVLVDGAANTIDEISYGSDTSVFNPSAPDVFTNNGRTLQRTGYPFGPFLDSDSASDWQDSGLAGSPCWIPVPVELMSFVIE